MSMTDENTSQDLVELFTYERPFGPTNATNITDDGVFRRLFDPNNKIIGKFKSAHSLIIGRKGSGKTSFLRGLAKSRVQESLDTAETFAKIVEAVDEKSTGFFFVEKTAQLWEHILILSLLRGIGRAYTRPEKELAIIRDYCGKHGLDENESIEDWLWKMLRVAKSQVKNDTISSVAAVIAEIAGEDYTTTKDAAMTVLRENKEHALVLVDSLEQYPVNVTAVAQSMAGLLHCVGEFNERNKWIKVRLCLPAELYHSFSDLSASPLKDFSNSVTLHWHPKELLAIAANRLQIFIALKYPRGFSTLSPADKKNPQDFLRQFLPPFVVNGIGGPEDSIAYILRHTQLMPRQLLRLLNAVFSEAYTSDVATYPVVDAASVVAGIRKEEAVLVTEVCSAFHVRYPSLRKVCEATIKYLPLVFEEGDLHRVFNMHGKKPFGSDDFDDFKRMLMEAAVIGRVLTEDEGGYVHGMFEYTAAHKLLSSTNDRLCLHPIFAEVFHYRPGKKDRPIYPYGTDPNSDDYRDRRIGE